MSEPLGFYLISDFHIDLNFLHDPKNVEGSILHTQSQKKRDRVVKQIFNWIGMPTNRIVAFVGDTSNSAEVSAMVWKEAAERFDHVLVVPGNHEYYYPRWRTVGETDAKMREEIALYPNIHLLEPFGQQTFSHDGTLFLGCCGWYNWDACPEYDRYKEMAFWQQGSNDSRQIQYDAGFPDSLAQQHFRWLQGEVEAAQELPEVERIVILTHTVPRVEFLVPPEHDWYYLNGSYHNSHMPSIPESDLKKKIKVWGYGHSHFRGDVVVDGIRYVNHARGYAGERHAARQSTAFKPWKPKWISLGEGLTESPATSTVSLPSEGKDLS